MNSAERDRLDLLSLSLARATDELSAPIDRIEVTDTHVLCWAGARKVALAYGRMQGGRLDPSGAVAPHPGAWEVRVVEDPASRRPEVVGKAVARFLKGRGW